MKKTFTKLAILTLLTIPSTYAIDESDVSKMLNDFGAKGIISKEELMKAHKKLKEIKPQKWKQINAYASGQMDAKGRVPSSNDVDTAAANIDTDSAEFQKTMEDVKKIMLAP